MGQLNITTAEHDAIGHAALGDGSATVSGTSIPKRENENMVIAFKNTCNTVVTVTFQGSNDNVFTNAWTLPDSLVLDATTGSDYTTITDAWPYVRAVFQSTGNPSSGTTTSWIMGN